MDIITLEKANHLFWLGRYTERVFQCVIYFMKCYDTMIDVNEEEYIDFCDRLDIKNIYSNSDDFSEKYVFDESNFDSIISNLKRAYDNAVVLREEITGNSIAYIEMSLNILKRKTKHSTILSLQKVIDYIYAFFGSIDDTATQNSKNIIRCGKCAERLDMHSRFDEDDARIERDISKLKNSIDKVNATYSISGLSFLKFNEKMDALDEIGKLTTFFDEEE